MAWEIDHLLVAAPSGVEAERSLAEAGLPVAARRAHPGQGTANACTPFHGAFLELLWCVDRGEIDSDVVRPLGLLERIGWRSTGACPFGICVRSSRGLVDPLDLPFATWPYPAPYAQRGVELPIVTPRFGVYEPLVFLSFDSVTRGSLRRQEHPPAEGGLETRRITRVALSTPCRLSAGVRYFADRGLFTCSEGVEPRMEIELDGGSEREERALGGAVPVSVRW